MTFRLTSEALDDLDGLTYSEAERSGWDHSMDIETQLWADFDLLGRNPGIGHLRPEITPLDLYFYHSRPYMIAYRRDLSPIAIVAVIHGARDLATILASRNR